MLYQCDRCAKVFDPEFAKDHEFRCLDECGGGLTTLHATPPDTGLSDFLARLATGAGRDQLDRIHEEFWQRMTARCPPEYVQAMCDVTGVLVLSHAPLTPDVMMGVLGSNTSAWGVALQHLSECLTAGRDEGGGNETAYCIGHESFADFLRAKLTLPDRDRLRDRLAEYCRTWDDRSTSYGRTYAVRFGPTHLLEAHRTEDAVALLTDWRFLEAKAGAGFVTGLLTDFRDVLALLSTEHIWHHRLELMHESLRREANFLARGPNCLFQLMWNVCWWYDHPDAAKYYDRTAQTGTGPLPWERDGPTLHAFVEEWRQGKAAVQPGFVWLRSLRPPSTTLDTFLKPVFRGHGGRVTKLVWSPDESYIASGGEDGLVRLWDARSGEQRLAFDPHEREVVSVAWSPDGRWIANGSQDGNVRVWDAASGAERLCLPVRYVIDDREHPGLVDNLAWSPDGKWLVGCFEDTVIMLGKHTREQICVRGIRVWEATTGEQRACFDGDRGVYFSPDGQSLATLSGDGGVVQIFDLASLEKRAHFRALDNWCFCSVSWSPDSQWIATGSSDGEVRIHHAATGKKLPRMDDGHGHCVNCLAWSPNGLWLVSGSQDGSVLVWDAHSRKVRFRLREPEQGPVATISWSLDGKWVASQSKYRSAVRIWETATWMERLCLDQREGVAWSPGGRWIASGSEGGAVCVWEVSIT